MKKVILPALALSLALGAVANAETSVGRIAKISPDGHSVALRDGETIDFSNTGRARPLAGFIPGDSVSIEWSPSGDQRMGESIKSASVHHAVGKVTSLNAQHGLVSLDNGKTYAFGENVDAKRHLSGYAPGDSVRIAFVDEESSGAITAQAIGSTSSQHTVGTVKQVDPTTGNLVLGDGNTFKARQFKDETLLRGLAPGDLVSVIWQPSDNGKIAEVISPADN